MRPLPGWAHEAVIVVGWRRRWPSNRRFLEVPRPRRDEGRQIIAMPVGGEGVLDFRARALAVRQLSVDPEQTPNYSYSRTTD